MSEHAEPAWAEQARKAIWAALAAFSVAGGVILAAIADDHVTMTEWVTIALALAGALAGPGAVYAVRNARTAPQIRDDLEHLTGSPVLPLLTGEQTHKAELGLPGLDRTPLEKHLYRPEDRDRWKAP